MKKKTVRIALLAVVAAVVGCGAFQAQVEKSTLSELAFVNIEALAGGEGSETSWECRRLFGDCEAYCGTCGTRIKSHGQLRGTHHCGGL